MSRGWRIRGVPVTIDGSSYISPIPNEFEVEEKLSKIIGESREEVDKAIALCLYCMKAQIFLDGNNRAPVIFANHYLIAHGLGVMVIPEKEVTTFKKLLISYYDGEADHRIAGFMTDRCWKRF